VPELEAPALRQTARRILETEAARFGADDGKPIFAGVYDGDSQTPELAEMLEWVNWRLRQE
jgi:hypothetical protein